MALLLTFILFSLFIDFVKKQPEASPGAGCRRARAEWPLPRASFPPSVRGSGPPDTPKSHAPCHWPVDVRMHQLIPILYSWFSCLWPATANPLKGHACVQTKCGIL